MPFSGTVEWSKGTDEMGLPTLIGKANIPARNLAVDVLIRKNSDASLPASHRDALLLVAWGGFGYADAAQALGVPIGTVRSRLNRARTRLRRELGGIDPTSISEEDLHG